MLAACSAVEPSTDIQSLGGPVGSPPIQACDYPTSFGTPQNTGLVCPSVRGMQVIARFLQDDSVDNLVAIAGFGQIHEGAVVTYGDYFAVPEHHAGNPDDPTDRKKDSYSVTVRRYPLGVGNHAANNTPV